MAFCTNCGNKMPDDGRFCASCGQESGAPAGPIPGSGAQAGFGQAYAPSGTITPLDYTIHGDNLQVARVRLKPGQEIYAEAGKMVYKTANVAWETRMSGNTIGEKLL